MKGLTRLVPPLAVAVALALWRTGFHVVPTTAGAWRGVSFPPGAGWAAAAAAAGVVLGILLARRPAELGRPLGVLLLASAPLLPVLTGHGLVLLALQGPALAFLASAALGVALARAWRGRALPRPGTALVLVATLGFYLALSLRLPGPAGPQGDEPHYLVMTESLLQDGDLDLANQFRDRAYASFFAGELRPHTSPASPPGTIYSVHTPGLPVLLLPAFRLGGYPGARAFMALLAALTVAAVFRLIRDVTGRPGWALLGSLALGFTPPLPFYAVAIYPEVPAALATALFLLWAHGPATNGRLAGAAATAAVLPWLHPKLLPLAALGLVLVLLRSRRPRQWVAATAPLLLSLAGLLVFMKATYGAASLGAAYGSGLAADLSPSHLPRGLAGLLLDRQYGLLMVGPLWALALPGLVRLARTHRADAARGALLAAAAIGTGAAFSMWWGGSCPPARFLVPALPVLALGLAPAVEVARDTAGALLGLGLAVTALAAEAPRAIHNGYDGVSALLRTAAPGANLDAFLPSFVIDDPGAWLLAATLLAALALAWSRGRWGLALGLAGYAAVAAGLRQVPVVDPRQATERLLALWQPEALWSAGPPPRLETLRVPLDLRDPPWLLKQGAFRQTRPLDLPPGLYRIDARLVAASRVAGEATARLEARAGRLPLWRGTVRSAQRFAPEPVLLPAGARRLRLAARGFRGETRVEALALVPEDLVPLDRRVDFPWPRWPEPARYRAGSGAVRTTALDPSRPEDGGFRVEDGGGRFLVECPDGGRVLLRIVRPRPALEDTLRFGARRYRLRGPANVALILDPSAGRRLGDTWVVPVALRSADAWIGFEKAAGR